MSSLRSCRTVGHPSLAGLLLCSIDLCVLRMDADRGVSSGYVILFLFAIIVFRVCYDRIGYSYLGCFRLTHRTHEMIMYVFYFYSMIIQVIILIIYQINSYFLQNPQTIGRKASTLQIQTPSISQLAPFLVSQTYGQNSTVLHWQKPHLNQGHNAMIIFCYAYYNYFGKGS